MSSRRRHQFWSRDFRHSFLCFRFCSVRNYSVADAHHVYQKEINNWLTCNLLNLSLPTLRDPFHQQFTKHMNTFRACIMRYRNIKTFGLRLLRNKESPSSVKSCLDKIISVCKSTPLIVLKFIRLKVETVLEMMPYFPNMKVIHLIRDPRGMFNSRTKLGFTEKKGRLDKDDVRRSCDILRRDLSASKFIHQAYPDRIKLLLYEDLADKPMESAKSILSFANLGLTPKMENFVKHMTSSTRDSCAFCTQRKSSAKTAAKWREQMKLTDAIYIYNVCEDSMKVLGYLPFTTSFDMKNIMAPSRIEHNVSVTLSHDDTF